VSIRNSANLSEVARVPAADAQRLLGFVGDAHTLDGPEPFTTELLDRLGDVMRCEFATYYRLDVHDGTTAGYVACSLESSYPSLRAPGEPSPTDRTAGAALRAPSPHPVQTWSAVVNRGARRRFETTTWASTYEVVDCAWTWFHVDGPWHALLLLHRQEQDFGERERRALAALRPHVSGLVRAARARRLLAELVTLGAGAEDESRGFVLLGDGLRIEHASAAARRIVERWFGALHGRLPAPLEEWRRARSSGEQLELERDGLRLVVDAPTSSALVLMEETVPPESLTARELEVLAHVAAGKPTAEIARLLYVAPATVSKHLEHVYRKLGVTSRTAAVAAVGMRRLQRAHGREEDDPVART